MTSGGTVTELGGILAKQVRFDYRGIASGEHGYLWIGSNVSGEGGCWTHTTSLRSLTQLRDLLDAMIAQRTIINRRKRSKSRRASKRSKG